MPAPAGAARARPAEDRHSQHAKIAFGEALRDLDAAAAEVASTGGAGLSTDELSDLYLHRAMATARADWNATARRRPTDARTQRLRRLPARRGADAGAHAEPARDPHAGARRFRARRRGGPAPPPRNADRSQGSADAQVALDGGAADAGGGWHQFPRCRPRRAPDSRRRAGPRAWGAVVPLDAAVAGRRIPPRAPLALDGATAGGARAADGRPFALVAEPKGGAARAHRAAPDRRLRTGSATPCCWWRRAASPGCSTPA